MGRHSSSSDDADEAAVADVPDEPAAVVTGRHSRVEAPPAPGPGPAAPAPEPAAPGPEPAAPAPESDEEPLVALDEVAPDDGPLGLIAEQMTEPPADEAEPAAEPTDQAEAHVSTEAAQAAQPAEPTGQKVGRGNQSTAADLALLRAHSDVRARVIAALVVPFVLYTAVIYLIGAFDVYLIWIWIPLVSAGVVAGSILDAEHRRRTGS